MIGILLKGVIAGVLVATALWLQERSTTLAAIAVSLPLTSIIALSTLWVTTHDRQQVSDLSWAILLIIAPSVVLFMVLPLLLKYGIHFWISMPVSCAVMAGSYILYAKLLERIFMQ